MINLTQIIIAMMIFSLPAFGSATKGQTGLNATVDRVNAALSDGDSKGLTRDLAPKLDLKLLDQERLYTTEEATSTLKNFFSRYPPKNFTVFENGTPKAQNATIKGKLYAAANTYQVTIILHIDAGIWKVIQLRIELSEQ
jgi:hypothetical protein